MRRYPIFLILWVMVYVCEHCQFHAETKHNLNIHITKVCTAHLQVDKSLENAVERARAKKRRKREQKEREVKHRRLNSPSTGEPSSMTCLDRDGEALEQGAPLASLLLL